MVQDHQLVCLQGQRGVRSSVVVTELDLEHLLCKLLDHGTHLTTNQTSFGKIHGQRNHVQQLDSLTHSSSQDKTTHEASRCRQRHVVHWAASSGVLFTWDSIRNTVPAGSYLKSSSAADAIATTPVESVFSTSG